MADAVKILTANTAGEERRYLTIRYSDIGKPVDTRTGDEIADDLISRMGLVVN